VVSVEGADGNRVEYTVPEDCLRKLDDSKTKGMVDVERERVISEVQTD